MGGTGRSKAVHPHATVAALLLAAVCAADAHALLWWRDKVVSARVQSPPALDGEVAAWAKAEEADEPGLILSALNDDATLYLRLRPDGEDGRALLSGKYRQELSLWFLDAAGKRREWGVQVSFGPPMEPRGAPAAPASIPEARLLTSIGVEVSTGPLPEGVEFKFYRAGKESLLSLAVPLSRLDAKDGRFILSDLVSTEAAAELRRRPEQGGGGYGGARPSHPPQDGGGFGGGRPQGPPTEGGGFGGREGGRRHGMGGGDARPRGSASTASASPPSALDLKLKIQLAPR